MTVQMISDIVAFLQGLSASSISEHSPTSLSGASGSPVLPVPSVLVLDADGNPLAGVQVTFAITAGAGSLTGATPTTDASGIATVGSWTLAAGANALTATATGTFAGNPVTFTATGVPPPTVSAILPNSGSFAGGTNVTITGTNFIDGADVLLGGVAATSVIVVNATTITATTGAHSAGTVNVVVTNPDTRTGTLVNGFTYIIPAPTVSSIFPIGGPTSGGNNVFISGADFADGATVTIGGVPATNVTVFDPGFITAITGAHAAGPVNVVVTNPGMQAGTLVNGFIYFVSNDNFADRLPLTGNVVTTTGSNSAVTDFGFTFFTDEPGEPPDFFGGGSGSFTASAWWTWTAPCSFSITDPTSFIDTIGSDFDTILAVFTGSSLNALTLVANDSDSGGNSTSRVPNTFPGPSTLNIVAGTVFQIRVRGPFDSAVGNITLHINTPCPATKRPLIRVTSE